MPSLPTRLLTGFLLLSLVIHAAAQEEPPPSPPAGSSLFGSEQVGEAALIGIFYDLKQNQQRQESDRRERRYAETVNTFLERRWDESVLEPFFKSTRALYTTQIFIPRIDAGSAPVAFGLEGVVQPRQWLIHYKGQVSPPRDGTYRFHAYCDDLIVIAVNGQTVLVDSLLGDGLPFTPERFRGESRGPRAGRKSNLRAGDWIPLQASQPVDLDILIGENPGGNFSAYLLYERQGETYQRDPQGQPIYPIFQLAPFDTPDYGTDRAPRFAPPTELWKAHQ